MWSRPTGFAIGSASDRQRDVRHGGPARGRVDLVMPIWLALRAKTEERVLDIAPDGLRTTIGRRSVLLSWSTISFVHDADSFVVIGRKNTNAFLVPNRAFVDDQARNQFVTDARMWSQDVRSDKLLQPTSR